MLQFLDGYPSRLPSRYADKQACFTKAYIISNIELDQQYKNIQIDEPLSWSAFKRRINTVYEFIKKDKNLMHYDENNIERIEVYK